MSKYLLSQDVSSGFTKTGCEYYMYYVEEIAFLVNTKYYLLQQKMELVDRAR